MSTGPFLEGFISLSNLPCFGDKEKHDAGWLWHHRVDSEDGAASVSKQIAVSKRAILSDLDENTLSSKWTSSSSDEEGREVHFRSQFSEIVAAVDRSRCG